MQRLLIFFALTVIVVQGATAQPGYVRSIERWRADHVKEIAGDSGWLTVAGLFWLKEGVNSIGSGSGFDIELTRNFKHGRFGEIDFHNGVARLKVAAGVEARSDGRIVSEVDLVSDIDQKQTVITVGSQTFYVIKKRRPLCCTAEGQGKSSEERISRPSLVSDQKGISCDADFEPFDEPKEILIANVLGGNFKMKSPGILRFKILGREFTVKPVEEDGRLFIIFRDLSSRSTTYGAGRFLYADRPVNGKVILDLNKAENPSCAFTQFATCPLPPRENRLAVTINAGEKRYHP